GGFVQRTVLGVLIVLLLGGLAAAFGLWSRPAADQSGTELPAAAPDLVRPAGGPMVAGTLGETAAPSRAEAESPPTLAAEAANVVVLAVHGGSGAPVADLAVSLWSGSNDDAWAADQSARTDANGR